MPANFTSKSCARPFDFDKDGDLDLFIGGRVVPGQYPKPVSAHIYRNDSKGGQVVFTDVTDEVAPALKNIGLVCDALVSDYDNDGWPDLVLAGEWMPVTFLKNTGGKFENITASTGIANHTGWWTSLAAGDFDNDGDMDYIAGNLGTKTPFSRQASKNPSPFTQKTSTITTATMLSFLFTCLRVWIRWKEENIPRICAMMPSAR